MASNQIDLFFQIVIATVANTLSNQSDYVSYQTAVNIYKKILKKNASAN